MSAQTTITRSGNGTHNGLLGAGIIAAAVAVAGLGLAALLLSSAPKSPTSQPAPVVNAPAIQADEHHIVAPRFDTKRFRAEERQPIAIGAPAAQHEPFPWNR
jgi:hypothetical protein